MFSLISAFYFIYFSIIGVYIIYLPKVLFEFFGYSAFEIGVVYGATAIVRFLFPLLFLKGVAITNRLYTYFSTLFVLTPVLFYLSIESFYLFVLAGLLMGVITSYTLPFIDTLALKYIGKNAYGRSRLFGSIGFMLVALVMANFLQERYNVLYAMEFFGILLSVLSLFIIKLDNKKTPNPPTLKPFKVMKHLPFWVSVFLLQVSFGAFYNFFTIYESENGISLENISYLWSIGVIAEIIWFFFQARFLKHDMLFLLKLSILLTAVRWTIVFLAPQSFYLVAISQTIHAFSFALAFSASMLYIYNIYEENKLAQMFLIGVSFGLGGFVGGLFSGALYGEYLFLYSAILAFAAYISLVFEE
jgi:PPP family 3-phenylpropionic acid transporter